MFLSISPIYLPYLPGTFYVVVQITRILRRHDLRFWEPKGLGGSGYAPIFANGAFGNDESRLFLLSRCPLGLGDLAQLCRGASRNCRIEIPIDIMTADLYCDWIQLALHSFCFLSLVRCRISIGWVRGRSFGCTVLRVTDTDQSPCRRSSRTTGFNLTNLICVNTNRL